MLFAVLILSLLAWVHPALGQLGEIIGYKIARYSECLAFVQTCPPVQQKCANVVCQQCTDLGESTVNSCCNQPTPYLCFSTLFPGAGSGGNSGNAYITSAPPNTDPNYIACQTALEYVSICESLTSNFDNLNAASQAACLCYSSPDWQPTVFDNAWSSCIAYASTADTSDYAELASNAGFCSSVGNVLAAPASGSAGSITQSLSGTASSVAGSTSSPASPASSVTGYVPATTEAPSVASAGSTSPSTAQPTTKSGGNSNAMKYCTSQILFAFFTVLFAQLFLS